jgi:ribulose-5-phosphate 4-epimerase/fuculose-1-phosphate aldolase
MTLTQILDELVTANRILAREGVVDSFGHVSIRHPDRPDRYLLSRARAPECIEVDDLMEFALDGTPVNAGDRKPYAERFIHGAVYEARSEVGAVVHHHSPSVIPFSVTAAPLSPVMHMCAGIGSRIPTWDSRTNFGDTNLLVTDMDMARTSYERPARRHQNSQARSNVNEPRVRSTAAISPSLRNVTSPSERAFICRSAFNWR